MSALRSGVFVPQLGSFAEPGELVALAVLAEAAGWDGFFVWDHVMHGGDPPACDAWVALGAIAVETSRLKLGPLVTPLARRRPWKVARECTTLDRLSHGRAVLGVGIGTDEYREYRAFAEPAVDDRTRAAMLDEALDVVTGLWRGERFSYAGKHYTVDDVVHTPTPVQRPRVPIWCAVRWPNRAPLRRAARWDGVVPVGRLTPDDVATLADELPSRVGYEIVIPSMAASKPGRSRYADAGATWWLESFLPAADIAAVRARIEAGPASD